MARKFNIFLSKAEMKLILVQIKFNKFYKNGQESSKALRNFAALRNATLEHNRKFNLGLVKFQRNLNRFADLNEKDLLRISSGFSPSVFERQTFGRSITIVSTTSYPKGPAKFDWRARGKVTPVKDQGYFCNGCWAFSALAALESQLLIATGKSYNLSEQQLIDCNRNEKLGNWGCDGGSQSSAYMYIKDMGIQETKDYPYDDYYPHSGIYPCRFNSTLSIGKVVSGYIRIRPYNETLLRDVVAAHGPVSFAFSASLESYWFYQSGIYDEPGCPRSVDT